MCHYERKTYGARKVCIASQRVSTKKEERKKMHEVASSMSVGVLYCRKCHSSHQSSIFWKRRRHWYCSGMKFNTLTIATEMKCIRHLRSIVYSWAFVSATECKVGTVSISELILVVDYLYVNIKHNSTSTPLCFRPQTSIQSEMYNTYCGEFDFRGIDPQKRHAMSGTILTSHTDGTRRQDMC